MLTRIQFVGYEPFPQAVDLHLGQVNVFVGANGSGKSRLLEAVGVFTAALCERDNGYVCQEQRGVRPGGCENGLTVATFYWEGDGGKAAHEITLDGLNAFGRQNWHHARRGKADAQLALASWVDGYQVYDLREEHLRAPAPNSQVVRMGKHGQGLAAVFKDALHTARKPFGVETLASLLPGIYGLHYEPDGDGISLAATSRDPEGRTMAIPARELGAGALTAAGVWALAMGRLTSEFLAIDNFAHNLHPALAAGLTRWICRAVAARDSRKQLLLATHQPGVLDGLDLRNPGVRLFLLDDHPAGGKRVSRVSLSEARQFADHYIPTAGVGDVAGQKSVWPESWGRGDEEWLVGG